MGDVARDRDYPQACGLARASQLWVIVQFISPVAAVNNHDSLIWPDPPQTTLADMRTCLAALLIFVPGSRFFPGARFKIVTRIWTDSQGPDFGKPPLGGLDGDAVLLITRDGPNATAWPVDQFVRGRPAGPRAHAQARGNHRPHQHPPHRRRRPSLMKIILPLFGGAKKNSAQSALVRRAVFCVVRIWTIARPPSPLADEGHRVSQGTPAAHAGVRD